MLLSDDGFFEGVKAESQLYWLAEQAIDPDKPYRKATLKLLLKNAAVLAPLLEEIEGTTDPLKIARSVLELTTFDERPYVEGYPKEWLTPDNAYSRRLARNRQELPETLALLDQLAAKSKLVA